MSDQSTEQKKHSASTTKLRRLRDEGQFPQSQDMRGFLLLSVFIGLFWALYDNIRAAFHSFILMGLTKLYSETEPSLLAFSFLANPTVYGSLALIMLIFTVSIGLALIDMNGFNVSTRSFKDGFKRLSPVSNVKERFSGRALHDLVRSLIVTIILASIIGYITYAGFSSIFAAPLCGGVCAERVTSQIGERVVLVLCILLLLIAIAEYISSRAFFAHSNKMTDTEVKRENKENYGSPEMSSHLKSLRQELLEGNRRERRKPNIIIHNDRVIFYLDFSDPEGEPPFCTNISRPTELAPELAAARTAGLSVIADNEAAAALSACRRGECIPEESFEIIGACLKRNGLV